ncbi:MAG: deoxyribonuclease IV [Desulfomonile tiedjei]|nr:deoxyribonuclease IV [Desulfomonile tiedjei]
MKERPEKTRAGSEKALGSDGSRSSGAAPLLGVHVSIQGSVSLAIGRGEALGCTAIQIFTKNANQWRAKPLAADDVRAFKEARERAGMAVVAHDGYLINLASPKPALLHTSIAAFREELDRAEELAIPLLIMHPGAHTGSGEDAGLRSVIASFDTLLKETSGYRVKIAVENTAGQGTALGYSLEHLARIVNDCAQPDRLGVCLDSCHAFAAGYDLRDPAGYDAFIERFDRLVGLQRLTAVHLNDAKKGLGSRVDRHEHIGEGMLGLEFFRTIMNDPRLRRIPKLLETPKERDGTDMDPINLGLLRSLISRQAPRKTA